jgi:hypothetical protein
MDGMQLVNQRRVMAIGLLHCGQTVYVRAPVPGTAPGTFGPPGALREAWQINNVTPESRLFDSRMIELCTPQQIEPAPMVPAFVPGPVAVVADGVPEPGSSAGSPAGSSAPRNPHC